MRRECFSHSTVRFLTAEPPIEKLVTVLEKISKHARNEIALELVHSSCNYVTFDEWNDKKNRKFLCITIGSYIEGEYKNYFLDLIQLFEDVNDATVLSNVITQSLLRYNINLGDVISCTTDNCSLMAKTAEFLEIWRVPCICHVFNLIFQTFINEIKDLISPIFKIIMYLNNCKKYTIFVEKKAQIGVKIKKKCQVLLISDGLHFVTVY